MGELILKCCLDARTKYINQWGSTPNVLVLPYSWSIFLKQPHSPARPEQWLNGRLMQIGTTSIIVLSRRISEPEWLELPEE